MDESIVPNEEYIFFNTYYDKEILRLAIHALQNEGMEFKLVDKSEMGSFRSPLTAYFEADIMVLSSDFEKASSILNI